MAELLGAAYIASEQQQIQTNPHQQKDNPWAGGVSIF
jgi:hypothetical protein